MFEKGDLVRISERALSEGYSDHKFCRARARDHGYLWLVVGVKATPHRLQCKSIADGHEVIWYRKELEQANVQEG